MSDRRDLGDEHAPRVGEQMPEPAQGEARATHAHKRVVGRPFSSASAQEAARKRWEREREDKANAPSHAGHGGESAGAEA